MNYLDILKEVSFGNRWFVTDEVCAAASKVLLQIQHKGLEIDSLNRRLNDATLQANEAQKALARLTEEKEHCNKEKTEIAEQRNKLHIQLQAVNKKYDNTIVALNAVRDDLAHKEEARAALKDRLNSLLKSFDEVVKERNQAQETIKDLEQRVQTAVKKYDNSVVTLENFKDDLLLVIKQKDEAVEALHLAHGRIAQSDQRAALAEGRLKSALERVEVMEKNLARFTDAKEKIHELLDELTSAVEEMSE